VRIAEYKIATASTSDGLAAEVNRLIKDRWQPFGAMVVIREAISGIKQSYMQPMVREARKRAGRLPSSTDDQGSS
jgi:hypothetical protein